ncbi:hypothetical protein KOW79_019810 [Hemibagrus wyckioides]|uniref:Immunoglobulin V-set domain-containing protein n=1 Tax=Hemibagrus wyckioides TaxID=337641 RepID=A0A9D3N5E4_9TELE|nr:hypothetical protein KOW79_019810 [Hemibagrus wyckioides]
MTTLFVALCVLFSLFTAVNSSDIKELHVRTVKSGEDVTMECNISSVTGKDKVVWCVTLLSPRLSWGCCSASTAHSGIHWTFFSAEDFARPSSSALDITQGSLALPPCPSLPSCASPCYSLPP